MAEPEISSENLAEKKIIAKLHNTSTDQSLEFECDSVSFDNGFICIKNPKTKEETDQIKVLYMKAINIDIIEIS